MSEILQLHRWQKEWNKEKSPDKTRLQWAAEKAIKLACENFTVEGYNLKNLQEDYPDKHFIIVASHLSNLDAPAALKAFPQLDLQIAADAVLFEKLAHSLMFKMVGKDHFTPIAHKKVATKHGTEHYGQFNPEDFETLKQQMEAGKTPWMATHPLSFDGKMRQPKLGPVYLAQLTGAVIIPVALELGGNKEDNLQGVGNVARSLTNRPRAKYHIGKPLELPPVNIAALQQLRSDAPPDKDNLSATIKELRGQAELVGQSIAMMLPEGQRYVNSRNTDVTDES